MRTFDRETFQAARKAWAEGEFGPEWRRYRELAAERGFLYPPAGTRHDDRESKSQRAIVYRAMADNPTRLKRIIGRSRSWSDVVDGIFALEARLAEDADLTEYDAAWAKRELPTHREAAMAIGVVLERIASSMGLR